MHSNAQWGQYKEVLFEYAYSIHMYQVPQDVLYVRVVYAFCNERGRIRNHYRKTSNISRTLVGNKIVENSDVVGASPVGAAPTASSFST